MKATTSFAAAVALAGVFLAAAPSAPAATWQYCVPLEGSCKAYLWLPPSSQLIRGALVGGKLGIELELSLDPEVRKACAECDLAIVYFVPHIDAVFHYWQEGNAAASRWLAAFDALARHSGHPEIARVPWITMGHSTAGIFSRNVAYRWPERVAGVIHIKSGNIHQEEHLPPGGSLAGVPFLAMNGQFESFGPEGGLRPELGRETQWVFVLKDIRKLREKDPRHLASLWIDLGADHFHGSPALAAHAALFIRKTARYRIPSAPGAAADPPGSGGAGPVKCLPLALEGGWLTDGNLYAPAAEPAPYAAFKGDRAAALWHLDEEIARATERHHARLGAHQCISSPVLTWSDDGDGWTLRAAAGFLDALPVEYGGGVGGKPCGHAAGPILFHSKPGEPVEQIGPDTFRVLRPAAAINIAASSPGDDQFRPTIRWGTIKIPPVNGRRQTVEFLAPPNLSAAGGSAALAAKASSGLPVTYEVEYGPVAVREGKVLVSGVPFGARSPLECRMTAYQMGRRAGEAVAPAVPVSVSFKVLPDPGHDSPTGGIADAPGAAAPLEIATASFFGAATECDLEGASLGPDGALYLAGNASAPARDLPGGIAAKTFGKAAEGQPMCGCGFVARLSGDGKTLLAYAEFAPGNLILTTVAAGEAGVYVSGYASDALEASLSDLPGLLRKYLLGPSLADAAKDVESGAKDPIAGRPGLGRHGSPCVLRLSADLARLECGTYLEGWQQVWEKVRVYRKGRENVGNYREYFWQPTHLSILRGGDLVVCHDGGYFRLLTEEDRKLAGDRPQLLERLKFYDVPDHVSRLSPDLSRRAWQSRVLAPRTDPGVAAGLKDGWPFSHYGNPRTHRMRLDKSENIYLCGWSASQTRQEPWWSPYLWRLDPATGKCTWRAYDYDPMSGGGNRMGGQVSDTAVVAVAPEEGGTLLAALIADGGNCVMEWSPKADGSPFGAKPRGHGFGVKLVHFWGQVHRIDASTREGLARARVGPWAWVSDMAAAPDKHVVAVGRWNLELDGSADAWEAGSAVENPNGFLRVFSPDLEAIFTTALPGVTPFELTRLDERRFIVVGQACEGAAPVKRALVPEAPGVKAGYYMILEWKLPAER